MTIALDYDGTYTLDPKMWDVFIVMASMFGHTIKIVTMRGDAETGRGECIDIVFAECSSGIDEIIYTNRKAKKPYCEEHEIHIDIWIDDQPEFLLCDAQHGGAAGQKCGNGLLDVPCATEAP